MYQLSSCQILAAAGVLKRPQFIHISTTTSCSHLAPTPSIPISRVPHFTFLEHPSCPGIPTHTWMFVIIHLHTAVSQGHGIISQSVTGHLAVIGAADGSKRAHMAGAEWVSSLVWSVEDAEVEIRLILMQHCVGQGTSGQTPPLNTSSYALGKLWFSLYAFLNIPQLSISLIHAHSFLSIHLPLCMHSCHRT